MTLPARASLALAVGLSSGVSLLAPAAAVAEPENRGPLAVETWDAGDVPAAGLELPVTVYFPGGPELEPPVRGPFPVVAVVHGAGRTGYYMGEMAQTLASYGFVAVVPSIPCLPMACNHDENADQIEALMAWAVEQSASADSPIAGRIDPSRRAVVGHSWGGLASLLVTARDPEIDAAVYLDPNDDFDSPARDAAPQVGVPAAVLRAAIPGACNSLWWPDTFDLFTGPKLELSVSSSAHCDVEEPTDGMCAMACGMGNPFSAPVFRRYTVAFLACALTGNREMADWMGGPLMESDQNALWVFGVETGGLESLACKEILGADAGVGPGSDATAPGDGGIVETRDGGAVGADGGGSDDGAAPTPDARVPKPDDARTVGADGAAAAGGADATAHPRPDGAVDFPDLAGAGGAAGDAGLKPLTHPRSDGCSLGAAGGGASAGALGWLVLGGVLTRRGRRGSGRRP